MVEGDVMYDAHEGRWYMFARGLSSVAKWWPLDPAYAPTGVR